MGFGLIADFISVIFKVHDQKPFCKSIQRSPSADEESTPSAQSCGDARLDSFNQLITGANLSTVPAWIT